MVTKPKKSLVERRNKIKELLNNTPETAKDVKKIIKPATDAIKNKVLEVCKSYKEQGGRIADACKRCGIAYSTFAMHVKKYPECREIAHSYGVGLKGDKSTFVFNVKPKMPKIEEKKTFTIFDLPTRKEWTPEQKQEAIKKAVEALELGVPIAYAVRYAGMNQDLLTEWAKEEPGLIDVLLQAEAKWAVTFFKCLTSAAIEAAKNGRFAEIVHGAERRFACQWGRVQAIDLTLRKQDDSEKHIIINQNVIDSELEKELAENKV